jgi:hypothetical protein
LEHARLGETREGRPTFREIIVTEPREFHDGAKDGLEALEALDPESIRSFTDLLAAMRKTAFGGRRLGEAFEVLSAMIADPDCVVVLTLSGAMTIAKMGKIISSMIDHGMVQAVVSTGALIAHGLSESVGKTHYRHDPAMHDEELFQKGYNRVYDTLEMESNLNYVEQVVSRTLKRIPQDMTLSSETLTRELGRCWRSMKARVFSRAPTSRACRSIFRRLPIPRWGWTWPPGRWDMTSTGRGARPRTGPATSGSYALCIRCSRGSIPIWT